ncbi:uncharacterized protein N7506_001834 [Penicillium brevicompactum]|uniref:uncharacterized protein n=1 Tax=Penicillium brevicompactum TaxID=5074 RepID=UPI00253F971E|nr:uncharacterized protein N7506_001834 [Penicillium brevicompactum]KAJ5348581.1 hypothetical protein N7506_001834 [Penicillium brevicompactum]
MSKALTEFSQLAQNVKNAPSKFTGAAAEGSRLIPSRTKDALFQFRVDAGRYNDKTKHLNVNLQVNSQAKSPALKDWVKKIQLMENLRLRLSIPRPRTRMRNILGC